jgi:hypothetical protein
LRNSDLQKLRARDAWCWHCASESDLVPHHRANRGQGGSRLLDGLQNIILVCAQYNGAMESDSMVASMAREYGHKLSRYESPTAPCFDVWARKWYVLDEKGSKFETEPPSYLI